MKKEFSLIIALLLALALLAGCGSAAPKDAPEPAETPEPTPAPLTAAEIVEKMQAALTETPCSKGVISMKMDFTMDAGVDGSLDMSTTSVSDITVCTDPISTYTKVTMDLGIESATEQVVSEAYVLSEDGELVSYTDTNGFWMKMTLGKSAEELMAAASSVEADAATAEIDDTVTQWEGRDALCLTTVIRGEALSDVIGNVLSGMEENEGAVGEAAELINTMDYSALVCDARLYLDPETYLPMAEEMEVDGMTELMAPMFKGLGISVTVSACSGTVVYTSYAPQAEIVLPEGIAETAETWTRLLSGEPDNGDGTFTIREGTVLVDIVPPEGFTLEDKDYDHVLFTREDHRTVCYTVYYLQGTDTTGPDFTALVDSTATRYEAGGGKVERETTTVSAEHLSFFCDILGTTWSAGREEASIFAWSPLGTDGEGVYYLFAEIADGFNDGFGNSKSADITAEEFVALLGAADLNELSQ